MDNFFLYLKKSLLAITVLIFAFSVTYVPQSWNDIKDVNAQGATEPTQITNMFQLFAVNAATTASAAFDKITAFASQYDFLKNFSLDGIAWMLAKTLVQEMVADLIDWINSGFDGSPIFVQDFQGFLLDSADSAFGAYMEELGGLASFVCEPFRLDVSLALATAYTKMDREDQLVPKCTLTGALENVQDFLSGTQDSFTENGGWEAWFDMTSQPMTYTPVGAAFAAQYGLQAKLVNRRGEEINLLTWGDGFMSKKLCTYLGGKEDCTVSTPGKIIQEALSFNIDGGRQALITADEIDEIISALLGGLMMKVFDQGLSESGGNDFRPDPDDDDIDPGTDRGLQVMLESLAIQEEYLSNAESYRRALESALPTLKPGAKIEAEDAIEDIDDPLIPQLNSNIADLEGLIAEYRDPDTSPQRRSDILEEYTRLDLYNRADITGSVFEWSTILENRY